MAKKKEDLLILVVGKPMAGKSTVGEVIRRALRAQGVEVELEGEDADAKAVALLGALAKEILHGRRVKVRFLQTKREMRTDEVMR